MAYTMALVSRTLMMYYGKAETYVLPQFPPFSGIQCAPLIRVLFILSNGPRSVTLTLFSSSLSFSHFRPRHNFSSLYCIILLFHYITLSFQPLSFTPYQSTSTTTFIICHHLLLQPSPMWMLTEMECYYLPKKSRMKLIFHTSNQIKNYTHFFRYSSCPQFRENLEIR